MNFNLCFLIGLISISIYECKTFNAINSDKLKLALKRVTLTLIFIHKRHII
jgi:hypothetical protein